MKFGQNSNTELNASTSGPNENERDDIHSKYMNDKENHVDQKNFNHNKFKNILIGLMLVSILGLGYYVFQLSRDKNKLSDEFVSEMSSIDQTDLPSNTIVKSTESTYSNNLSSAKNTNYTIDQMNLIRTFGDYDESEGFFYYSLNSDELGSELIKNFNNAWIDYVNEGIQNIFNYTVPDSPAYEGSIDFDPENSSQKFLEINVGQATLIGQDLFIKVNEKLEITKPDGVTVKNYDWIYQAKFHTDKFKVFDYFNDDYPADDQVVNDTFDINTLPFYTSGTFAGGDVTDGLAINEIRYGSYDQYDRFVFDCFEFASSSNSKSNIVPFYNVKFNSDTSSAMFYFNGVREFDATLDKLLESSAVSDVFFLPVYDDQAYAFIIDFRPGTAIKVFEMEDHARIILDILK